MFSATFNNISVISWWPFFRSGWSSCNRDEATGILQVTGKPYDMDYIEHTWI